MIFFSSELLCFWRNHYLSRKKDCEQLEQSSSISFDQWRLVVDVMLHEDKNKRTSILYYLTPHHRSSMRFCAVDFPCRDGWLIDISWLLWNEMLIFWLALLSLVQGLLPFWQTAQTKSWYILLGESPMLQHDSEDIHLNSSTYSIATMSKSYKWGIIKLGEVSYTT